MHSEFCCYLFKITSPMKHAFRLQFFKIIFVTNKLLSANSFIFHSKIIFKICIARAFRLFPHWIQMCFKELDVRCFLISTFALQFYSTWPQEENIIRNLSYQPCLKTDIHCTNPPRMSTSLNTHCTRWSTEHPNVACGKATNYEVFIKAQRWTGKTSRKNNYMWEHLLIKYM